MTFTLNNTVLWVVKSHSRADTAVSSVTSYTTMSFVQYPYAVHYTQNIGPTTNNTTYYVCLVQSIVVFLPIGLPSAYVLSCYSVLHVPGQSMIFTSKGTHSFKILYMNLPVLSCKIRFITKLSNLYCFPVHAYYEKLGDLLQAKWNSCVWQCKEYLWFLIKSDIAIFISDVACGNQMEFNRYKYRCTQQETELHCDIKTWLLKKCDLHRKFSL